MEINRELIVREVKTGNNVEYTIKKYKADTEHATYLREVFPKALPSGLVHKDETGMGATYLELAAERNSIIVEPIKITASSKAKHHKALYVGSETKVHPGKVSVKDIEEYIAKHKGKHIKIVVVADSLYKVITAVGKSVYDDYFILIDEIDSFQMDSFFRRNMESVMDTYKMFPPDKRAMVSATPLAFSDPELANEPVTFIKYDRPTSRNMQLFNTENLKGAVAATICAVLTQKPDDKIMVAYNSVSGCLDIAKYIIGTGIITKEQVKILCSVNSKNKVSDFYTELTSTELPGKLNFVTSAYFTGFDLIEDFHLISVSGNETDVHTLSDKRLKQIAGRCREKLLSETVVYDLVPFYKPIKEKKSADLIKAAEIEIKALDCIKSNFFSNDLLKGSYDKIRSLIIANTQPSEHQYVRLNKNQEPVISYLNIDSDVENNRVSNELYRKKGTLAKVLRSAGHKVKERTLNPNIDIEPADEGIEERTKQVSFIVDALRNMPSDTELLDLLHEPGITRLQKEIINQYNYLYNSLDREQILNLMVQEAVKKDMRGFNNLMLAAFFVTLDPADPYKRSVTFHIPLKGIFTREELLNKWKDIFTETAAQREMKTETQAVRFTKLHFKITERKDKNSKKFIGYFIKSENPLGLIRIGYNPLVNHQTEGMYVFKAPYR